MGSNFSIQTRNEIIIDLGRLLADQADRIAWERYSPEKWGWMKEIALAQGVAPLLSRVVRGAGGKDFFIPETVRRDLDQAYYRTVAANHLFCRELDRILAALTTAGVTVVVLKGAALAASLYGDIGLRPMSDLDLWIDQSALSKASKVMRSLGYQQLNASYHLVFSNQDGTGVELHWQLINLRNHQQKNLNRRLWELTAPPAGPEGARDAGRPDSVRMLLPSANVIYLAAHLVFHHRDEGRTRLLWLFDLHRLISDRLDQIDWAEVADLASASGFALDFERILSWVNFLYGTTIPDGVLTPDRAPVKIDDIPLWGNPGQIFSDATGEIWNSIRSLDYGRRLPVILGFLFPAPAYITSRYQIKGKWLLPLGYLRRWGNLLIEGFSKWNKWKSFV